MVDHHAGLSRAALSREKGFGGLIGDSPMHRLYDLIGRLSQSASPVLLLGETGTGKELVARAIHFNGPRREKVLVPVDCSALAPTLVESELFGHAKGAFTGADHSKRGLLQAANEGTIFWMRLANSQYTYRANCYELCKKKRYCRSGPPSLLRWTCVIAATNQDLETDRNVSSGPVFPIERRANQTARASRA